MANKNGSFVRGTAEKGVVKNKFVIFVRETAEKMGTVNKKSLFVHEWSKKGSGEQIPLVLFTDW